jgi:hypothetical protein
MFIKLTNELGNQVNVNLNNVTHFNVCEHPRAEFVLAVKLYCTNGCKLIVEECMADIKKLIKENQDG